MSVQLTRQQINEFKIQLLSRYHQIIGELGNECVTSENHAIDAGVKDDVESNLEGLVDLLFDINFAVCPEYSDSSEKFDIYNKPWDGGSDFQVFGDS